MAMQVDYDDQLDDLMGKVNEELKKENIPIQFEDDGEIHEGYQLYNIVKKDQ